MVAGFEYHPEFVSARECAPLLDAIAAMPLAQAQYKQFTAKRRVLHFGGRYDFSNNELLSRGSARWEWQHRVPPVPQLRYSITFRTLR
ncbi:MAG: hypothetical protein ACJ8R9_13975 [Steroidobacteraceae bacterium]